MLLGNGDGTFQPQITYAVGSLPSAIVTGDFNGDGRPDLAVETDIPASVVTLLGQGDGSFQTVPTVGSEASAAVAADFNGDGHPDLAVANDTSSASRCCWAMATARCSPRWNTPLRPTRMRSWRRTSTATAGSTSPSTVVASSRRVPYPSCWATATARSSPRSITRSRSHRRPSVAGGLQRRRQARPGPRECRERGLHLVGQRRRHLPLRGHHHDAGQRRTRSWRVT